MASKGTFTPPPERWKHLRKFCKRLFWKRERKAAKKEFIDPVDVRWSRFDK